MIPQKYLLVNSFLKKYFPDDFFDCFTIYMDMKTNGEI